MVDQNLLHIPNILLHHDDNVIIIMKEEEKGIFAKEGDFGPHNFLQSFLGAGWYYDDCRQNCLAYFLREELNSPSPTNPPTMILIVTFESHFGIL